MKIIVIFLIFIFQVITYSQVIDRTKVLSEYPQCFVIPIKIDIHGTHYLTLVKAQNLIDFIDINYNLSNPEKNKIILGLFNQESILPINTYPLPLNKYLLNSLGFGPDFSNYLDEILYTHIKLLSKKGKKYVLNNFCKKKKYFFYDFKFKYPYRSVGFYLNEDIYIIKVLYDYNILFFDPPNPGNTMIVHDINLFLKYMKKGRIIE